MSGSLTVELNGWKAALKGGPKVARNLYVSVPGCGPNAKAVSTVSTTADEPIHQLTLYVIKH